ncbi:MAG: Gfo/Idh/MocA family oxidoreductase [Thermomicrobiales bacterium]
MTRLRTGVIGCGAIAQMMHLPYLRELEDRYEISALCDWDPVTLANVGAHYGVDRLFSTSAELLEEPLDAVLILSSGDHAPDAITAIERGLHVLVEKPLSYTLRQTDAVIAAQRPDRTMMVGMMKQYDPGYQRGVELVQQMRDLRYVSATTLEAAGTAYQAHHHIERGQGGRAPGDKTFGAEMFNAAQQGILGSQPLDLLREATGSDDPSVLVAYFLLIVSSIHDINALRGALGQPEGVLTASVWAGGTSFTATLGYADDVRANYTWTLLPHIRSYSQNFHFYGSDEYVKITFPSPYLASSPTYVDRSVMAGDTLEETRLTVSYEEAFKRELIEFADCIATGRTPRTTPQGFRQDLEVLTAIARKLAEGAATSA